MERAAPWVVGKEGIRPAGSPGHCFYCHEPKGGIHAEECVIRSRTVVVQVTVDLVVDVPEHWTVENINFRYNESTWCADNLVDILGTLLTRIKNEPGGCLCPFTEVKYLAEADATSEREQQLFAEMLPS